MRVFINKLRVFGPIGWFDHEREEGVELFVDIIIDFKESSIKDDLKKTIDYLELASIIKTTAMQEMKLLETYAEACIYNILAIYRPLDIVYVKITIEKALQHKLGLEVGGVGITKEYFKGN